MFRKVLLAAFMSLAALGIVSVMDTPLTAKWQRVELMGGYQMVRMSNGDWVESYVYDSDGRLRVHNWTDFNHVNHSVEYDVNSGTPKNEQIMTQSQ